MQLFLAPVSLVFVPLHDDTFAARRGLIRVLRLLDLRNEQLKSLGDVFVVSGAGFGPATIVLFRQLLTLVGGNLTLLRTEIALVSDNDNGNPLDTLKQRVKAYVSKFG